VKKKSSHLWQSSLQLSLNEKCKKKLRYNLFLILDYEFKNFIKFLLS
jgi:hypothetical protein